MLPLTDQQHLQELTPATQSLAYYALLNLQHDCENMRLFMLQGMNSKEVDVFHVNVIEGIADVLATLGNKHSLINHFSPIHPKL